MRHQIKTKPKNRNPRQATFIIIIIIIITIIIIIIIIYYTRRQHTYTHTKYKYNKKYRPMNMQKMNNRSNTMHFPQYGSQTSPIGRETAELAAARR